MFEGGNPHRQALLFMTAHINICLRQECRKRINAHLPGITAQRRTCRLPANITDKTLVITLSNGLNCKAEAEIVFIRYNSASLFFISFVVKFVLLPAELLMPNKVILAVFYF